MTPGKMLINFNTLNKQVELITGALCKKILFETRNKLHLSSSIKKGN